MKQLTPRDVNILKNAAMMADKFVMAAKGNDIRAINIALIELASMTVQRLPPSTKFEMQERFLKAYIKATDAPFTFYKLGH